MPIYEYQCGSCQEVTEVWQSLSEEPMSTCPSCSGTMKKLISQSSFHLKGGGWYADGYNGKSNAAAKSTPCSTASASTESSCPAKGACKAC
ncbi:MAG: zinc ribbon domain-containing protein [Desulfobulbaceae bacterium]|nr:zinc ribbon domain-containing protein [Desulfobulbaceae bacterium]HIJ79187.1 zinc ribbon domain-containing protein [Deltaproteobacteria bacterium]